MSARMRTPKPGTGGAQTVDTAGGAHGFVVRERAARWDGARHRLVHYTQTACCCGWDSGVIPARQARDAAKQHVAEVGAEWTGS